MASWRVRPQVELLEERCVLSWTSVPPARITLPIPAVRLQSAVFDPQNNASGFDAIINKEVDYFRFFAPMSGVYRIAAQTPASDMDTVAAVFRRNGTRLAFNDDVATDNSDSEFMVSLTAGQKYFLGVTNYRGKPAGSYYWLIDGPGGTAVGDDAFEENDTFFEPADVAAPVTIPNLVMVDGADWYRFDLTNPGNAASYARISFLHAQGDLDLFLYDAEGNLLDFSNGTTNSETISLNGLAAGTYSLFVLGYAGASNPNYTLEIVPGSTVGGDDVFEDNDELAQAFDFGTLTEPLTVVGLAITAADDDWFRFTMNGTGTVDHGIAIQFTHALGDLDLFLVDAGGIPIASSESTDDDEFISLDGFAAGTYFVQVIGFNGDTNPSYTLDINPPSGVTTSDFQIDLTFSGLSASQQAVFQQAANRWAQIITGDLPDTSFLGTFVDDLLIDASGVFIDGQGGILGQAGPDSFRGGSQLPFHGIMEFDTADLAALEAAGTFFHVILHEMGHVLGIGGFWERFGLVTGKGTSNPRFTGPQALAEYNAIFGLSATGVPLENTGGPGTRDVHWRESLFGHELMTGFIEQAPPMPISRITVGALQDIGYTVNLNAADNYTPPGSLRQRRHRRPHRPRLPTDRLLAFNRTELASVDRLDHVAPGRSTWSMLSSLLTADAAFPPHDEDRHVPANVVESAEIEKSLPDSPPLLSPEMPSSAASEQALPENPLVFFDAMTQQWVGDDS